MTNTLKDERGNYTVYEIADNMDEVRQLLNDDKDNIFVSFGEIFNHDIHWDVWESATISITKEDFEGVHGLSGEGYVLVHLMYKDMDISTAYCHVNTGVFARNECSEHVIKVARRVIQLEPFVQKVGLDVYKIAGHLFTEEQIKKALNIA